MIVGSCFCFIPLRLGCILIGGFFMVANILELIRAVNNFSNWTTEEKGVGTIEQRSNMFLGAAIRFVLNATWVLVGFMLILAVIMKRSNWLTYILVFVIVSSSVILLFGMIHFILSPNIMALIIFVTIFVLFIYFSLVIWSFKCNQNDLSQDKDIASET